MLPPLVLAIGFALGFTTSAAWAQPARQMAVDRGCYNCHGEPPRRGVRPFVQIAGSYAHVKDEPAAQRQALDRMHHGSLFSHVAAHERLSDEDAATLVQWLFQGGS
jgi:cytochrome c